MAAVVNVISDVPCLYAFTPLELYAVGKPIYPNEVGKYRLARSKVEDRVVLNDYTTDGLKRWYASLIPWLKLPYEKRYANG